jgi:hypothetical protein
MLSFLIKHDPFYEYKLKNKLVCYSLFYNHTGPRELDSASQNPEIKKGWSREAEEEV